MKKLKQLSLIIFFSSILICLQSTEVRAQKGFSKASPAMMNALKNHLKASPKKAQNYKAMAPKAKAMSMQSFLKAYDLNPNDLSFKAGSDLGNAFIIIFPVKVDVHPSSRVAGDRGENSKLKAALNVKGIFPSRNIAAFIMRENKLGNFEIQ